VAPGCWRARPVRRAGAARHRDRRQPTGGPSPGSPRCAGSEPTSSSPRRCCRPRPWPRSPPRGARVTEVDGSYDRGGAPGRRRRLFGRPRCRARAGHRLARLTRRSPSWIVQGYANPVRRGSTPSWGCRAAGSGGSVPVRRGARSPRPAVTHYRARPKRPGPPRCCRLEARQPAAGPCWPACAATGRSACPPARPRWPGLKLRAHPPVSPGPTCAQGSGRGRPRVTDRDSEGRGPVELGRAGSVPAAPCGAAALAGARAALTGPGQCPPAAPTSGSARTATVVPAEHRRRRRPPPARPPESPGAGLGGEPRPGLSGPRRHPSPPPPAGPPHRPGNWNEGAERKWSGRLPVRAG